MRLSDRELATVLAALRHWQQALLDHGGPPIADHFGEGQAPLPVEEIDELCERLNCSSSGDNP